MIAAKENSPNGTAKDPFLMTFSSTFMVSSTTRNVLALLWLNGMGAFALPLASDVSHLLQQIVVHVG